MTIEERAKKGADSKARGVCNCTRAVLAAFEDVLKIDPDELTRLTAGFAAGMGNLEGTCGALVGAVMVAGILTDGKGTPRYSREIMEKFKDFHFYNLVLAAKHWYVRDEILGYYLRKNY